MTHEISCVADMDNMGIHRHTRVEWWKELDVDTYMRMRAVTESGVMSLFLAPRPRKKQRNCEKSTNLPPLNHRTLGHHEEPEQLTNNFHVNIQQCQVSSERDPTPNSWQFGGGRVSPSIYLDE